MSYNHKIIDKKWQEYWDKHQTFKTMLDTKKPKYYAMDMFPYPSGAGLHMWVILKDILLLILFVDIKE